MLKAWEVEITASLQTQQLMKKYLQLFLSHYIIAGRERCPIAPAEVQGAACKYLTFLGQIPVSELPRHPGSILEQGPTQHLGSNRLPSNAP